MYDYDSCPCEQAAWRVYDLMCEHEPMYFEAHVTDDEESPNGFGWYFSSHLRNADGTWSEYDGGSIGTTKAQRNSRALSEKQYPLRPSRRGPWNTRSSSASLFKCPDPYPNVRQLRARSMRVTNAAATIL